MTEPTTPKIALFACANLAAAGIMLRGKRVTGDWQVHRVGCRDLTDLQRISRRKPDLYGSVAEAREAFNADMGGGGGARIRGWRGLDGEN